MISKTHISGQEPHGRQLNKKVCGSKSAIFVFLILSFFVQTTLSNNDNSKTVQALTFILARNGCSSQRTASQPVSVFIASNSPWSIKAIHYTPWLLFVVKDAIFMRTRSLVPRPNTCSLVLERHFVHKGKEPHARLARSLPVVVGRVCEHHTGKALNSAANL